jgi:hypothetical protein
MRRFVPLFACLTLAACTTGVAPEIAEEGAEEAVEDVLGGSSSALQGGAKTRECSADQQAWLRQGMMLGRTVARSAAFAQCLAKAIRSGDGPRLPYEADQCRGDPYHDRSISEIISKVQAVAKSANVTNVRCYDPAEEGHGDRTLGGDRHGYDHAGEEKMEIDIGARKLSDLTNMNWLSFQASSNDRGGEDPIFTQRVYEFVGNPDRDASQPIPSIWHEAMHAHGYEDCGPRAGYGASIPTTVEYCLGKVALLSAERCSMTESCDGSARLSLIDGYPVTNSTGCTCVRDAVGEGEAIAAPATPHLAVNEAGDYFGAATTSGDFNGDGFADLAVGAPGENDAEGRVFIYYGSVFGLTPAVLLSEDPLALVEGGDRFGASLASTDFNLDGEDDLAVGAPGENNRTGAVLLFRGTRAGLVPERVLTQASLSDQDEGDEFGSSLATGTFFAGRGKSLIVGAPGETLGSTKSGAAYVFGAVTGSADLVEPWGKLSQPENARGNGHRFGASVATGSIYHASEAIEVGAPQDGRGKVYVFDPRSFGSAASVPNDAQPAYFIAPDDDYARWFGWSVAAGVDFAGAANTIVVGAPLRSGTGGTTRGAVYVYQDVRSQNPSSGPKYEWVVNWVGETDHALGLSLAKIGQQGARHDQLLVGVPGRVGGGVLRLDRVFKDGRIQTVSVFQNQGALGMNEAGDGMGSSIAVGDFDGDGEEDWAAGATGEKPGSDAMSGAVFAFRWNEGKKQYAPLSALSQED